MKQESCSAPETCIAITEETLMINGPFKMRKRSFRGIEDKEQAMYVIWIIHYYYVIFHYIISHVIFMLSWKIKINKINKSKYVCLCIFMCCLKIKKGRLPKSRQSKGLLLPQNNSCSS